jgi:5-formyltetrahydrofolate cyclo-ligase
VDKRSQRRIGRAIREGLAPRDRIRQTHVACALAARLVLAEKPRAVGLYAPMGTELDVACLAAILARHGVATAYPAVTGPHAMEFRLDTPGLAQPWRNDPLSVFAPDPAAVVPDVLVVPGLAFDSMRDRLGYGGGFYDRYLAAHPGVRTVGIGYSRQLGTRISFNDFDRRLDATALGSLTSAEPFLIKNGIFRKNV